MTKKDAGSATGGEEEKKNNVDTVQAKKKQKKGANSTPKPTPLQGMWVCYSCQCGLHFGLPFVLVLFEW